MMNEDEKYCPYIKKSCKTSYCSLWSYSHDMCSLRLKAEAMALIADLAENGFICVSVYD